MIIPDLDPMPRPINLLHGSLVANLPSNLPLLAIGWIDPDRIAAADFSDKEFVSNLALVTLSGAFRANQTVDITSVPPATKTQSSQNREAHLPR